MLAESEREGRGATCVKKRKLIKGLDILSHDHQLLTNSLQSHNYLHASIEVLIFGVQVL